MAAQSPRDAQFHMQPGSIVVDSNDSEKKLLWPVNTYQACDLPRQWVGLRLNKFQQSHKMVGVGGGTQILKWQAVLAILGGLKFSHLGR